ncbi:MAG: hypothetical protein HY554_08540 [Elusimicrobia bacterium]|nr:hypothetical protein [Elusimicrobiota bacterium]
MSRVPKRSLWPALLVGGLLCFPKSAPAAEEPFETSVAAGLAAFRRQAGAVGGELERRTAELRAARQAPPASAPEALRVYESLFPAYVEVCTVTQYKEKGGEAGGFGGHATMFLSGACRVEGAAHPRLELCESGSGVGVSVNQAFANANWVAVPGRGQFFLGGLSPEAVLDRAAYDAAVRRAVEAGWFRGIAMRPDLLAKKPAGMSDAEHLVRSSIGTDFALGFARNAYCARLPMRREALGKVVAYLNALNEKAGAQGYHWNLYTNNCSHAINNALAAAGVLHPKTTRGPGRASQAATIIGSIAKGVLGLYPDLSFPANNFVRVVEAGNELPIDDARAAFRDRRLRLTLEEGWSATAPGALVARYPMHPPALNRLFEPGRDPFVFGFPGLWPKASKFKELVERPRPELADLGRNLEGYQLRYGSALRALDAGGGACPLEGEEFPAFRTRLRAYLEAQLADVEAKLLEYRRLAP